MAYIGNSPGVASQRIVTTFTATASQTTFTPTSGYTVGYLDVYHNGVKLINGDDYTASNGSTFVLAAGASAGDVVESVAYLPRGLSDGYTKAEADARYVEVAGDSMTGTLSITKSAATVQTLNRTDSDGTIADFQKNGTIRGQIGLEGGDSFYIANTYNSNGGGIHFHANGAVSPMKDGVRTNNYCDLGSSSFNWRDLYLSGGVVFGTTGGTVTSRTLDDYEEGTWTPIIASGTMDLYQSQWYKKIGSLVICTCYLYTFSDTSSSTAFEVGGLPFASQYTSPKQEGFFQVSSVGGASGAALPTGAIGVSGRIGQNGATTIGFAIEYPSSAPATFRHSHLGAAHLKMTFMYSAAS